MIDQNPSSHKPSATVAQHTEADLNQADTKEKTLLDKEIKQLRQSIDTLNQHKLVRRFNSTFSMLWFQFLRGIAFGLGSVVGATIVVSVGLALLAQIELIPIIGEWTKAIIEELQ